MINNSNLKGILIGVIFTIIGSCSLYSQKTNKLPVFLNKSGMLEYTADTFNNRVPDYSYCGYKHSEESIPDVPIKAFVAWRKGDATHRIQKAINYISSLPLNGDGFRGAILLDKGTFRVSGRLRINKSGIILRGSGIGENGTTLIAAGKDRETLIKIIGSEIENIEEEHSSLNSYTPVNSNLIHLDSTHTFKVGDHVYIRRPSTKEWIDAIKMNEFGGETSWLGWKPGRNNIIWDRKIKAIDGNTIILDIPITTALDPQFGGGYVARYSWQGRISNIGIENINLISEFDNTNLKDEDHCWFAITIENAADCWVRQVNFKHFAGSAVAVYETAKQITVEDCISQNPVSEIGGQRRYTFFTSGQQTLFQRCYAEYGYHDFSVGNFTAGPNAFVQCESHLPYSFSGTIDRWASGVLFDLVNIDGHNLSLKNREQDAQGAGWTAANCMIWQCSASRIDCYSPPTATNWAYGTWGQFSGNGFWFEPNSHIKPRSLFYAQLSQRTNDTLLENAHFLPIEFGSTSSPTIELAKELTKKAYEPIPQLKDWIQTASTRTPISIVAKKAFNIDKLKDAKSAILKIENKIKIQDGWIIDNNGVVSGSTMGIQWWRGNTRPQTIAKSSPHLTRFVPGRTGTGLTDDIESVSNFMAENNICAIDHHYGLWYDRRRDDHERIRRADGEVCPPFYELPFARTGVDLAWDGLSKYDLTKPNYWYWSRLKTFADQADQKGLILIHQNYFQHNIIEAGAHYADFPWRTANNINNTSFSEPPPYSGDKRIFIAEQFYDITNENLKALHKQYIWQCLENFKDNTNVIQFIGEEYTGPLHFVEFWLDVISEWETQTGKKVIIGLSTTKDVQDAILADTNRSKLVDIINIKYWQLRGDGTFYAPKGGQNLAPRQHARLTKPGKISFESVYKAVSEYKLKYPGKAISYSNRLDKKYNWAVFMAGGSMADIPEIENIDFLKSAASMQTQYSDEQYTLKNKNGESIIYNKSTQVTVDLKRVSGSFSAIWINPETGITINKEVSIEANKIHTLTVPIDGSAVLWIKKNN